MTGALGDIDGDGTLDYVSISSGSAVLTDANGVVVREKFLIKIDAIHLESRVASVDHAHYVPVQAFVGDSMKGVRADSLQEAKWQGAADQLWGAYMGTAGTSIYTRGQNQ